MRPVRRVAELGSLGGTERTMKYYVRQRAATEFLGPHTIEEICLHLKRGSMTTDHEVVEAVGQTYGALKRCTDWKRIADVWSSAELQTQTASVEQTPIVVAPSAASDVRCPKCAEGHPPGVFRCSRCSASLRPVFLGIVTIVGPLLLAIQILGLLAQIENNPVAVLGVLINCVGIAVLIGLRFGRYWAWVTIQILWVINIAFTVFVALGTHPALLVVALVQALIIAALWAYIHTDRVKAFCAIGRPP